MTQANQGNNYFSDLQKQSDEFMCRQRVQIITGDLEHYNSSFCAAFKPNEPLLKTSLISSQNLLLFEDQKNMHEQLCDENVFQGRKKNNVIQPVMPPPSTLLPTQELQTRAEPYCKKSCEYAGRLFNNTTKRAC